MEWAIGKQYDVYPSNTGKLLLPGARIRWEVHVHSVGEEIRDTCPAGHISLSQGRDAEVPDAPDGISRQPAWQGSGYSSQHGHSRLRLSTC